MTWRPLVAGEERAAILAEVRRVARDLASRTDAPPDAELARGDPGVALLLAYLGAEGEDWASDLAAVFLERALAGLGAGRPLPHALLGGWLGAAWTAEHLRSRLDLDDDPNEHVAPALAEILDAQGDSLGFELVYGLAGFTVFAGERGDDVCRALLLRVAACLERQATENRGERTWWVEPRAVHPLNRSRWPDGCFDLGVAHGVPGVLVALARCHRHGAPDAAALCRGGARWLLAREQPHTERSAFPDILAPAESSRSSRLGWCYGDAGIAGALAAAAEALDDEELLVEAHRIGRRAALRDAADSGVDDASLCHGSAGLVAIFQRLWHATGDDVFARAARFWLAHAAARLPREDAWTRHGGGFLMGKSGAALALLAATSEHEPAWDASLLLSV